MHLSYLITQLLQGPFQDLSVHQSFHASVEKEQIDPTPIACQLIYYPLTKVLSVLRLTMLYESQETFL